MSFSSAYQQLASLPSDVPNLLFARLNGVLQDSSCNSAQHLDVHNVPESSEALRHICRVCGKCFRASSLLDIHMRVHVGAKPFVCPVCNHRATQKGNLKLHMKKHHGQDLPPNIDIIPDSGIWGNFDKQIIPNPSSESKKSLAHSSLLDPEVVELIKKCQNNIGQSGMGRISESLKDFIEMAQSCNIAAEKHEAKTWKWDNSNSNNNGVMAGPSSKQQLHTAAMEICKRFLENNINNKQFDQQLQHYSIEKPKKAEVKLCYCQVCGWETTSPGYLNVHMRKHKEETHVCSICGRAFKETWYLKNHMRSHINDIPHDQHQFFPEVMRGHSNNKETSSSVVLNAGLSYEDNSSKLEEEKPVVTKYSACNLCGHMFSNDQLSAHFSECKSSQSLFEEYCKYCCGDEADIKKTFMQSLDLLSKAALESKVSASKKIPFTAELNPLTSVMAATETESSESKTPSEPVINEAKQMLRQELLRSIVKKEDLKRSLTHLGAPSKEIQPYQKSTLSFSLSESNIYLKKNLNQPYRNSAMQSLAEIGKTLLPKSDLQHPDSNQLTEVNMQNQIHDGDKQVLSNQQGFQCRYCLKWFKYRSVLGIHMRSHTGERPYKCAYCGYAGTQHNCLKLHIQRHHPKEYIAAHNNMVIQNKIHMQSAQQQHGKKQINKRDELLLNEQVAKFSPARCPICGRVSPSPGYLKIHMRSHKKTLDHVCHVCGRGFKEYWYLSTHLRTHNRELSNMQPLPSPAPSIPLSLIPTSNCLKDIPFDRIAKPAKALPSDKVIESGEGFQVNKERFTSPACSWSPAANHTGNTSQLSASATSSQTHAKLERDDKAAAYVSKRKAFQPSKCRASPYRVSQASEEESCTAYSRRKSKPKKYLHGSYMTPVFKELTPIPISELQSHRVDCDEEMDESDYNNNTYIRSDKGYDDKPLDLSVTTTVLSCQTWKADAICDEPLNLVIK